MSQFPKNDIIIKNMKLIVGLGNPDKKYKLTRHNLGFRVLDRFSKENCFSEFTPSKKFKSLTSERVLNKEKVVLIKPQTYMNESGKAVKALRTQYKLSAKNIWVIHDDIDLDFKKIKIVQKRGSGGHKGVLSIINEIKTKDFVRFRLGIKPKKFSDNRAGSKNPEFLARFVLQKFGEKEKKEIKKTIKDCAEIISFSLKEGLEKAMNQFNK